MAESETECDTPGLDTLGSECVITHTQVGDLHYAAETEIMTQEDKRLDLEAIHGDLGAVACVDAVTETDHDYIKSEVHHDPQYFGGADMKGNEALLGEVLLKAEMGGAGAEHVVKVESDHGGELTVESENGVIIHEAQGLQCNECGEIFGSMTDLHQHFEMHKATHPYICIQCGESFAVEASLRGHMKIHMKEKGYATTGVEMVAEGIFSLMVFILIQNGNGEECITDIHNRQYSCLGRNLTYIPTSIPLSVETLDFSFNFLPSLQKRLFPPLYELKVLDLTRCQIQSIADDAFHNVRNVTTLILTGNPISYTTPGSLNSLLKLKTLVLVDTVLLSLNAQFNNLTQLQELNVGTNKIQSIALPRFMINFKEFCVLDLHANNISSLKINDTAVLREIRRNMTLILYSNPILQIEPGVFQGIYLTELNVQSTFVSFDALKDGLKALSDLTVGKLLIGNYIVDKRIKISDVDYLNGLCSIHFKEIYFLQKEYSDSDMNLFRCMVNATKITLKQAYVGAMHFPFYQLKELYIHQSRSHIILELSHLHMLEKLVVDGNKPVYLTGLNDLPKLQHVDLSGNEINLFDCCSKFFTGMPNIQILNLSRNAIIYLSKYPFAGLESLKILDIHLTNLRALNAQFKFFKSLKHLQYLDVSYTEITFLRTMAFRYLSSLKILNMAGNSFQGDALSHIFQNVTTLEVLHLSNCGIQKIDRRAFQSLSKLRHLYLSQNKLTALDFATHLNLKSLIFLDVGANSIFSIPPHILQNLPTNLSSLDLSSNPIDCSCPQIDFIIWLVNHQQLTQQSTDLSCKILSQDLNIKIIDFNVEGCLHIKRLTIALCICAAAFFVFVSLLIYKFQYYLRYGYILLRGYKASRQQECSYDAFVIYSSKDESWVIDELVEKLENGTPPIQLCLHVRDFEAGKAITSNIIDEGIMGSRKIIVVVSKHFIESSWCRFEFEVAQSWLLMQRNANIIIIILEDVEEEKSKKVFGLHKHLKNNTYLTRESDLTNICTQIKNNRQYSCLGRNLTYIPTSIPLSVETLDFSFNFLPSLQKRLFPPLYELKVLDLTRCQIQSIADDAFHNVRNVTTLILTGNPISYTTPGSLNSLLKLKTLVLVDTVLLSLNAQFNNLTQLQELNVGTNKIQSIALPRFMINFKEFCVLDLHANNISSLKINDTAVLREMRRNITLILYSNPILQIEPGVFQGIYLTELNLLNAFVPLDAIRNGLKALSGLKVGKLLIGNYRLTHRIEMSDNDYLAGLCMIHFTEIYYCQKEWSPSNSRVVHCMVNATKITLKRGWMKEMEHVPFRQLKELYIGHQQLTAIPNLLHVRTLEKLVVVDNNAVTFPGLSNMTKLQHVDLSRNSLILQDCCAWFFQNSLNIRHINLSLNANIMFSAEPFHELELIEELDFHGTTINVIGQFGVLQNLKYLKYLDISYTRTFFSSYLSFHRLKNLKILKMAGNTVQENVLTYLFENLTSLELLDMSHCGIAKIPSTAFRNLQKLSQLLLSRNKLMVLDFLTQSNLQSLMRLAVDQNSISVINLNTLQNIPANLSVFDISSNPFICSCSQTDYILWIIKYKKLFFQSNNILCKPLLSNSNYRVIDFDIEGCLHIKRLTIALCICAAAFFVFVSLLIYKFQFYLRYGYILLRGYKASRQQECSYDAFVIYSSKDESWVIDELVEKLENGTPPIQLCLHVRDFEAGKAITSNIIDEGIMGSRKIIVVVSKHFIESSWCRFEFEVAQSWLLMQRNANIIIIILEDVEEEKSKKVFGLHKHLKNNTYLKWSENPINNLRFWIRLRKAVIMRN
ncbi:Toll-like receptor 4 [Bagarius yarrelli]|uniref:Toll-like receptor 4 n=1 Tax=Bagarius yarrelli TaxID=175774 RepID=A0A556V6A4_BAGYA|nr:Toll-like receptor 4 [Bagarius yarrelli]